jgi:isopropylmalate/homocitrate/citramalate synthase
MESRNRIILRDSTLREGLDVPGVRFAPEAGVRIARELAEAGIVEAEIVAPARVIAELPFARLVRAEKIPLRTSGLIYASKEDCRKEIDLASGSLDRFDLLMPLSPRREPKDFEAKKSVLLEVLRYALSRCADVGAGFPHSTQVEPELLIEIAAQAAEIGATRMIIYDTNGSGDPFAVRNLIERVAASVPRPLFFHGHNDLGMATANSLAAVVGGASGLDVTVNGLGDRAGNASLEQVAIALASRGFDCGVDAAALAALSRTVEELSGVPVSKLAPGEGEFAFAHKSPGHLGVPTEFEAFAPSTIGRGRSIDRSGVRSGTT